MKLGMDDYVGDPIPHAQNENGWGFGGGGEIFTPSVLFWFRERTSSLPGKDWLGALCTQKRVLVVS